MQPVCHVAFAGRWTLLAEALRISAHALLRKPRRAGVPMGVCQQPAQPHSATCLLCVDCLSAEQMVHPQKRPDVRRALDAALGRTMEVRNWLVKLNGGIDRIPFEARIPTESLPSPTRNGAHTTADCGFAR